MGTLRDRDRSLRAGAPMDAALEKEIDRLERLLARVWQLFAAAGMVLGVAVGWRSPGSLGWGGPALTGCYLAWFRALSGFRERRVRPPALRWVVPIVEATIPWCYQVDVFMTQGPVHALGSWLPPLLY